MKVGCTSKKEGADTQLISIYFFKIKTRDKLFITIHHQVECFGWKPMKTATPFPLLSHIKPTSPFFPLGTAEAWPRRENPYPQASTRWIEPSTLPSPVPPIPSLTSTLSP